jgi:ribosomal protein L37AE/L43A
MATCPLCSDTLLHHFRSGRSYWLCRRCRTEITDVTLHGTRYTPVVDGEKALLDEETVPSTNQPHAASSFNPTPINFFQQP